MLNANIVETVKLTARSKKELMLMIGSAVYARYNTTIMLNNRTQTVYNIYALPDQKSIKKIMACIKKIPESDFEFL